jgi:two-component system, response regulator PdtaR
MATARQPNVLLVEDEPLLRTFASEQLRGEGLCVVEAPAGAYAIALLEQHPEIDVLFTDMKMPGAINGLTLASVARQIHPHLVVILTSGKWTRTDDDVPEGAVFVEKPYSIDAVAQLVKALVKPA